MMRRVYWLLLERERERDSHLASLGASPLKKNDAKPIFSLFRKEKEEESEKCFHLLLGVARSLLTHEQLLCNIKNS